MISSKFGRLTVLSEHGAQWRVRCDCGTVKSVRRKEVLRPTRSLRSCGCLQREAIARVGREKNRRHGQYGSATWASWSSMRNRCNNPQNRAYPSYGGRGIAVCERWETFEHFYADMGDRPEGKSIDRIDNDGPYAPENCRWATARTQSRNRRHAVRLETPRGPMLLVEAAEAFGVAADTLRYRLKAGWSVERALTEPVTRVRSADRR